MTKKNTPATGFNDQSMETMIGRLLQIGVLLASATVLIGGILYLRTNSAHPANYRNFSSEPGSLRHPLEMMHLLAHGDPAAVIQLGILLLIATPIARVLFAVIGFAIQRDRLYVLVSLIVLAVLMFGIFR